MPIFATIMTMKDLGLKKFQQFVLDWYKKNKRDLPWRRTDNPYHIWVSEIMLQQTQVARVIPKYEAFLKRFPTAQKLAKAELKDVLILWQGLGYNRRGKFLYLGAKYVVENLKGVIPQSQKELQNIPGIGPYIGGAISAFAYNQPAVFIETNIRTVFIHHFFKDSKSVHDKEIMTLIEKTLPRTKAHTWYSALMDYGTYLKSNGFSHNAKSKHYTKQSKFEGSFRQLRANILKKVLEKPQTEKQLQSFLKDKNKTEIQKALQLLVKEKMIQKEKGKYQIN
jgi:A/G-specific adenine glycosylase